MFVADTLIVGGGSAGCVLAARLSEDPARRVILIEAGQDLRATAVPADIANPYPGRAFLNSSYLWNDLKAFMGATTGNEPGSQARTKIRTSENSGWRIRINAMVANRGAPSDYDEWGELGAEGWSWESVLPYFRKLETDCDFNNEFHGQDGPITIRRRPPQQCSPFVRAARDVLTQKGLSEKADQNGLWEDGSIPRPSAAAPTGNDCRSRWST